MATTLPPDQTQKDEKIRSVKSLITLANRDRTGTVSRIINNPNFIESQIQLKELLRVHPEYDISLEALKDYQDDLGKKETEPKSENNTEKDSHDESHSTHHETIHLHVENESDTKKVDPNDYLLEENYVDAPKLTKQGVVDSYLNDRHVAEYQKVMAKTFSHENPNATIETFYDVFAKDYAPELEKQEKIEEQRIYLNQPEKDPLYQQLLSNIETETTIARKMTDEGKITKYGSTDMKEITRIINERHFYAFIRKYPGKVQSHISNPIVTKIVEHIKDVESQKKQKVKDKKTPTTQAAPTKIPIEVKSQQFNSEHPKTSSTTSSYAHKQTFRPQNDISNFSSQPLSSTFNFFNNFSPRIRSVSRPTASNEARGIRVQSRTARSIARNPLTSSLLRGATRVGGGLASNALKLAARTPWFWIVIGIIVGIFILIAVIILIIEIITGKLPIGGGGGGTLLPGQHFSLTKTASPAFVTIVPGHEKEARITYTITPDFNGDGSVDITDPIPNGTNYVDGSASPDPSSKQTTGKNVTSLTWNNIENGTSITFQVQPTHDGAFTNIASGTLSGNSGISPTANTNTCNGRYTTDIQNNYLLHKNFGDPNCTLITAAERNDLYNYIKQVDPANADWWFNTIIPCESGYDPNSWLSPQGGTPDPHGAWGLFQDGSSEPTPGGNGNGLNGKYDRGDVEWHQQVFNAAHLLQTNGSGYWACSG